MDRTLAKSKVGSCCTSCKRRLLWFALKVLLMKRRPLRSRPSRRHTIGQVRTGGRWSSDQRWRHGNLRLVSTCKNGGQKNGKRRHKMSGCSWKHSTSSHLLDSGTAREREQVWSLKRKVQAMHAARRLEIQLDSRQLENTDASKETKIGSSGHLAYPCGHLRLREKRHRGGTR